MGKRQAGFGAVYRRADGRWEGQIRIPGGRRRSLYGHSRRDLIHKLVDARWSLGEGLPVSAGTQSLRAYLEYWLMVCRSRLRLPWPAARIFPILSGALERWQYGQAVRPPPR
jgi:hypothetical protein